MPKLGPDVEKILRSWSLRADADPNMSDEARAVLKACHDEMAEAYFGLNFMAEVYFGLNFKDEST